MPKTLLLADDSVTIQRIVELTFAGEDISIVVVGNGDRAIGAIRHSPPDIVLADVDMPGLSGYEVARHIKQSPALSHIPVLLLTGAFEPVDQALALEVGSDGVLTKPLEPGQLVQQVKALLGMVSGQLNTDVPAPVEMPQAAPQVVARLDDYFQELDQALASRVGEGRPETYQEPAPSCVSAVLLRQGADVATSPLAGAFSSLLSAEKAGSTSEAFADWLSEEPEPAPVAVSISEETIEAVVRRVLDRLSETVVRDAVTAVASATAERLVSEEIERIKSNIK